MYWNWTCLIRLVTTTQGFSIFSEGRYFQYNELKLEDHSLCLPFIFDPVATPISLSLTRPPLLIVGPGQGLERRCGCVFNRAYKNNRENLYLDAFCPSRVEEDRAISDFSVRASVLFRLLGSPRFSTSINHWNSNTSTLFVSGITQISQMSVIVVLSPHSSP